MAVKLRLARHGQKKRPFYRIIAAESQARRDGRFLDIVGTYNPMTEPATVSLKEDKIRRWISEGAQATRVVGTLIKSNLPGLIEEKEAAKSKKIQEQRAKRKARNAGKAKPTDARRERKKAKRKKGADKQAAA